jgi:hypothetical protein
MRFFPSLVAAMVLFIVTPASPQEIKPPVPPAQLGGKADPECPRLVAKVDLSTYKDSEGRQRGSVDAGMGLTLKMQPKKCPDPKDHCGCIMTVWYQGIKVKEIKTNGYFTGYSTHVADSVTYWVVEDYSGGAHCCTTQAFFCRPAPEKPVKFLGAIGLGHGDPLGAPKLSCRGGKIYFEVSDWRFAYFHTSFAQSFAFPRFYQLSPEEIKLSNDQFKQAFLDEVKNIELQIKEEAAKRQTKPAAIIAGNTEEADLTDGLANLLVARTVNLLCAREGEKAWKTFESDVKRFYQTSRGVRFLQREIKKRMAREPY